MNSKGARGKPISPTLLRDAPWHLRQALNAQPHVLEAASLVTTALLQHPDTSDDDGPLVHAWAIHAAFLAGVSWERENTSTDPFPGCLISLAEQRHRRKPHG